MKKWIVICMVVLFLFSGYAFSQDCGKCPAKTSCLKAKVKKDKTLEMDPVVLVIPADKKFHKEDCELLADQVKMKLNAEKMKLSQAKEKGFEPCETCFPPEKKEIKKPGTDPKK